MVNMFFRFYSNLMGDVMILGANALQHQNFILLTAMQDVIRMFTHSGKKLQKRNPSDKNAHFLLSVARTLQQAMDS